MSNNTDNWFAKYKSLLIGASVVAVIGLAMVAYAMGQSIAAVKDLNQTAQDRIQEARDNVTDTLESYRSGLN